MIMDLTFNASLGGPGAVFALTTDEDCFSGLKLVEISLMN